MANKRVTLRSPEGQVVDMSEKAAPFFENQGYVRLDAAGRVMNTKTASAATNQEK